MPDTNRLPRIGEIWKARGCAYDRVVILNSNDYYTYFIDSDLETAEVDTDYFVECYVPTGTEYDLDPLVLALKGDRT